MELLDKYERQLTQPQTEKLLLDIVTKVNSTADTLLPNFGIGTGKGGAILLNCHYGKLTGDDAYYAVAEKLLMASLQSLSPGEYKTVLSNYFIDLAEFGALIGYLEENGHLNDDTGFAYDEFDTLIADRIQSTIEKRNFGLGNGALSVSSYLYRRIDRSPLLYNAAVNLLEAIYQAREGDQETGYYWTTHYFEEPRIYTGLSHGNGMILNFLCSIHEKGIEKEKCEELMRYALRFLLLNRADPNLSDSNFQLWLGREIESRNHCIVYGDLSTAYIIIKTAKILEDANYLAFGIDVAKDTIRKHRIENTSLMDASIKYGVSSPYILYNRIFQLTGLEVFKNAAVYWLDQITEMKKNETEYLGFNSHFFKKYPEGQLGFSFGLAGIGLVLMQYLSDDELSINEFTWTP